MLNLDCKDLIQVDLIHTIALYRWAEQPLSFQQLVLMRTLTNQRIYLRIFESPLEYSVLGRLPLLLVNNSTTITKQRFLTLSQTFYLSPNIQTFLVRRATVDACMRLINIQRLYDIHIPSRYWILFSPKKKVWEWLRYIRQVNKLGEYHINDKQENLELFAKHTKHLQKFLQVEDPYCQLLIETCVRLIDSRNNCLTDQLFKSQRIRQYKKRLVKINIQKQPIYQNLFIVNLKAEQQQPKPPQQPNKGYWDDTAKLGFLKLGVVTVMLWLPILMFSRKQK